MERQISENNTRICVQEVAERKQKIQHKIQFVLSTDKGKGRAMPFFNWGHPDVFSLNILRVGSVKTQQIYYQS